MSTPVINTTGEFTLLEPFSAVSGAIYKCASIEGFGALDEEGVNVFATYYSPHGITEAVYTENRLANVNIITLRSDTAATITLPDSFIYAHPTAPAVAYSQTYLMVDLGLLPDDINLDDAATYCTEAITALTGVTATSELVTHPVTGTIDAELDATLIAARVDNMEVVDSYYKAFNEQLSRNLLLTQKIETLESLLEEHL